MGYRLAEKLHVDVGDSLVAVTQATDGSMGNEIYDVVGLIQTGAAQLDRTGALIHLADLQELLLLGDQVHEITLLGADDSREGIAALATDIQARTPDALVQTWWQTSPPTDQMLSLRDSVSFLVLGAAFLVAAFGVFNTMMMSVLERTRELGVLRAIGLRPGRLIAMVLFESIFLGVIATAMGLVLGGLADAWMVVYGIDLSGYMESGFAYNGVVLEPIFYGHVRPGGILLTVAAVFITSVVAALLPAWRASRLEPVVALRHDLSLIHI